MPEPASADADLGHVGTLKQLFEWRVARTPEREAYRYFDAVSGAWVSITWRDLRRRVARFCAALAGMNLPPGARVAILLPNGVDAVCSDLAALSLGYVPVPMHALDNPASIAYILDDSGASLLLAASAAQWLAIAETGIALAALRAVVALENDAAEPASLGTVPLSELGQWLASAPAATADATHEPVPADLAALVYTSGTTGRPKGVMLT